MCARRNSLAVLQTARWARSWLLFVLCFFPRARVGASLVFAHRRYGSGESPPNPCSNISTWSNASRTLPASAAAAEAKSGSGSEGDVEKMSATTRSYAVCAALCTASKSARLANVPTTRPLLEVATAVFASPNTWASSSSASSSALSTAPSETLASWPPSEPEDCESPFSPKASFANTLASTGRPLSIASKRSVNTEVTFLGSAAARRSSSLAVIVVAGGRQSTWSARFALTTRAECPPQSSRAILLLKSVILSPKSPQIPGPSPNHASHRCVPVGAFRAASTRQSVRVFCDKTETVLASPGKAFVFGAKSTSARDGLYSGDDANANGREVSRAVCFVCAKSCVSPGPPFAPTVCPYRFWPPSPWSV